MSTFDVTHWGGRDRIANLEAEVSALANGGSQPASLVPVATRGTTGYQALSNGTDTGGNYKTLHQVTNLAASIRVAYGNFYGNGGNTPRAQFDGPNDITVTAAVWPQSSATGYRIYFNGQTSITIKPGAHVVSDELGLEFLTLGAVYYIVTYVTVTSGGKWPTGLVIASGNSEGIDKGTSTTDETGTGVVTATSGQAYSPLLILGKPTDVQTTWRAAAAVGDSIINGSHDTASPPASNNQGWLERAFGTTYNMFKIAQPGEYAQDFASLALRQHRTRLLEYATHAVYAYGRNDITNGRTAAQVEADMLSGWNVLAARRLKVWAATVTPITTSTDSWATTANQTSSGNDSVRVTVNTWLRDGAPILNGAVAAAGSNANGTLRMGATGHPVTGLLEVADPIESARNSGIWQAGYCFDGTHPNATGYAAIAAAINPATVLA